LTQKTFSAAIADAPLRPFQVMVIAFGLALLVIDGIDLQSLPLVVPEILAEWGIDREDFGTALSASLFGMAFGSVFGGMLGDRIGRLRTLFIACMIFGSATIAAGYTNTAWEMTAVRALGGLGFGAAYPNGLALVSDWVSERWRPHAVSILSIGIPVGISVSAFVMPYLLPGYGWRGTFMIFGAASIVLGFLVILLLREPPPFLLAKGRKEAAQRNAARVIDPAIDLLPEAGNSDGAAGEKIGIFHRRNKLLNIGMVISFSATTALVYGLLNWTTELLTTAGFTPDQAREAGVWQGALSVVGGLSAGLTTRFFGSRAVTIAGAAAILLTILALGWMVEGIGGAPTADERSIIIALEGLAVGLVSMMITVFYVVMAHGYPASCRAGGIGFIITSGRLLSIAMVFYGGTLISMGGEGSFIWYFAALTAISLLVFAAAFIVDCHVQPKRAAMIR